MSEDIMTWSSVSLFVAVVVVVIFVCVYCITTTQPLSFVTMFVNQTSVHINIVSLVTLAVNS